MDEYIRMMLDECERMFPTTIIDSDIKDCWESDTLELTMEMNDGNAFRYDCLFKTLTHKYSVNDFYEAPSDEQEWRDRFSRKLHRVMTLKGCSQNRLAWLLDISTGALSNYVNGARTPSAYLLTKIAEILEVSLDYLTGCKQLALYDSRKIHGLL